MDLNQEEANKILQGLEDEVITRLKSHEHLMKTLKELGFYGTDEEMLKGLILAIGARRLFINLGWS